MLGTPHVVTSLSEINGVKFMIFSFKFNRNWNVWVRFQVLTAASMKFGFVFWDVLPCKVIVDRRFRGDITCKQGDRQNEKRAYNLQLRMRLKYSHCSLKFDPGSLIYWIYHSFIIHSSQALIVQDGPLAPLFGVSWSHTYIYTVELLCTSDQPVAETSTYAGKHNI
jgi:hypothetical protein